jgi:hypothetical protein
MPREKWLKRRQDEGPPPEDIVREYFGPRGEKKDDRPRQETRPEAPENCRCGADPVDFDGEGLLRYPEGARIRREGFPHHSG